MRDDALWAKLQAQVLPRVEGVPLSEWFSKKQGLSAMKAALVVQEYRRFLYLIEVSDRPLSMPPALFAIWSAYDGKGAQVSPKGHESQVDPGLSKRSSIAYAATLSLYWEEFGPPISTRVWPSPSILRVSLWAGEVFQISIVVGLVSGITSFAIGSDALESFAGYCILACVVSMLWVFAFGPWGILGPAD